MIVILVPLLIFCLLNIWTIFIGRRSFGISFPITCMSATLTLFFSQYLCGSFNPGILFLIVAALSGIAVFFYKRKDRCFIDSVVTNGLIGVIVLFALILILDFKRHYAIWDEFSHWGMMVKEMCRLNSFYSESTSHLLIHKEYPPFAAIFEMFWCKLAGGYSEMNSSMAIHFLGFSAVILPMLEQYRIPHGRKQMINNIVSIVVIIVSVSMIMLMFDEEHIFNSIYTDMFISMIFVYGIFIIMDGDVSNSGFGVVALAITQSSLILIKQVGIAFVLLIWFFYTINLVLQRKLFAEKKRLSLNEMLCSILMLAIPTIIYGLWSVYVKRMGLKGQFDFEKIRIFDIIKGNQKLSQLQSDTFKNYLKALTTRPITSGNILLTYVSAAILVVVILCVIHIIWKDRFTRTDVIKFSALFCVGSTGYVIMMSVLYLFCYSEIEMNVLVGYIRYHGGYLISCFLIIIGIINRMYAIKEPLGIRLRHLILMFGIVILISDSSKIAFIMPQILRGEPNYAEHMRADYIQAHTENNKQIFICAKDTARIRYVTNYYINDRIIDTKFMYDDYSTIQDKDTLWNDVINHIADDDYIYIVDCAENMNKMIGKYSENNISDETLYKISSHSGEIKLERVN